MLCGLVGALNTHCAVLFLGCPCLNLGWRRTNCNMAFWLYYGTPCAVFSFHVLASTSHKIEEWQKGVLIVMWTCWCTKHTLCGAFPGLCLPQHLWEDLTSATNCNMAFWLRYGTPCAVFSFHVPASTFLLRASIVGEEGCNCDMDLWAH